MTATAQTWLNHPAFDRSRFGSIMHGLGFPHNTWLFTQDDDDEINGIRLVDSSAAMPTHESIWKAIDKRLRDTQIRRIQNLARIILNETHWLLSEPTVSSLTHAKRCEVYSERLNAIKWLTDPTPPPTWMNTDVLEMRRLTSMPLTIEIELIDQKDATAVQQAVTTAGFAAAIADNA